jgi:hypothetical protein
MKTTKIEKMNQVVKNMTSSGYKMGDLFTLTVGDDVVKHDTREYYSGRGKKYNSSIRHGSISVVMNEKELNAAYKPIAARIKEQRESEKRYKKYLKHANDAAFISEMLQNRIDIISEKPAPEGDNRYYVNGYHGCGVYRLAIINGRIVATIHGGFHNSCPNGTDQEKWLKAILAYVREKCGNDVKFVKADGSGCEFFLRDEDDAELIAVKEYNVPAPNGNGNMGFMHHNVQVAI